MKPEITYIASAVIAGITAVALGFLLYKGTTESGQRYLDATKSCIESGGSWVPWPNSTKRGLCIGGRQ